VSGRDWPWAMLDEVATVTAGNPAPQRTEFFDGGSRPFVRVQDLGRLNGASHLTKTAGLVNDRAAATLKLFPRGSVLFTKSGASLLLNQRAILGRDMHVVSHIGVAVPGPRITSEWLYYWLRTVDFADIAHGANMPSLPLARVKRLRVPVPPVPDQQRRVAEIEKQLSRLDEAVASLKRAKLNIEHYERSTIEALTSPSSFSIKVVGTVSDVAESLDNMREPVNKTERAKRVGTIPYLGANGRTGWIDEARFDEELVLVVEDETFVGRKLPFSYYFSGKCWVNNHTHVLRARRDLVLPKYLNLALSYYPFIPLTTGSTGRRKLTKAALMSAPIKMPTLEVQRRIVSEVDRRLSILRQVEADVDANLERAQALWQAVLATAFCNGREVIGH